MINLTQRNDDSLSALKCFRTRTGVYRDHKHLPNILELIYVTDGRARHVLEGKEDIIKEGDYFVVDAAASHAFPKVFSGTIGMIVCRFNLEYVDSYQGKAKDFSEILSTRFPSASVKTDNSKIYHDADGTVLKLFEGILSESSALFTAYAEKITCLLTEIFIAILRNYDTQNSSMSRAVKYVVDYTNVHFSSDVSLLELSKELYVSHSSLSQNFKKEVGVSFNAYLQRRRILQSCSLLAHTESPVEQIAEIVGYSDTKYFREVFKKIMDCTPREFRSNVRRSKTCGNVHSCLSDRIYNDCELRKFCIYHL